MEKYWEDVKNTEEIDEVCISYFRFDIRGFSENTV